MKTLCCETRGLFFFLSFANIFIDTVETVSKHVINNGF